LWRSPPRRYGAAVAAASERIAWAVERLDLAPAHRVLELGCGHGVAVSLIAARLAGGTVVAVDRSPRMIEAAARRNAGAIAAGVVRLLRAELAEAPLDGARFDRVLAAIAGHVHGVLERGGFAVRETIVDELASGRVACVVGYRR
jgi:cyclopropane fatty-acyl-phospholipid synthase-like methyltransferase